MITIGSCFSGIGGLELGLERAIPDSVTVWQIEANKFCRKVLAKHWPKSKRYQDIREVEPDELPRVDIICGGFPCQDISLAGLGGGLDGKKSGVWYDMLRVISALRPRCIVLENVPAITNRGLCAILGQLAELGYDAEWCTISAKQMGAPHLRRRWFLVAYPNQETRQQQEPQPRCQKAQELRATSQRGTTTYTNLQRGPEPYGQPMGQKRQLERRSSEASRLHPENYWDQKAPEPVICRMDDGARNGTHRRRLDALGNAVVPQCAEYVGRQITRSGILGGYLD